MNGFGAVTAALGVLALVGAALIATVGRMQWPRVTAALVLTGVAGILNSTIGPTIRNGITNADSYLGQFIGRWTGTAVTGVIGLIVLAVAAFWIYQGRIDLRTLGVTAAIPPTITLIPGTLGTIAVTVVGLVPWVVAGVIGWLFGIG